MRKEIFYDNRAKKEYYKMPIKVQTEFNVLIEDLGTKGILAPPDSKKLKNLNLYELRLKVHNQIWRGICAYVKEGILFLVFLQKKSQKTSPKEIDKSISRLNSYE